MAKRGRKVGPLTPVRRAKSTAQRKATIGKTSMVYQAMWGEKPKKNNYF